jgi:Family of unknown function (DUF6284)
MARNDPTDDMSTGLDDAGPTAADLAAIETEWPLIEAEMDLVAEEIRRLTSTRPLTALDWRRLRRAEARVMREALALAVHIPLSDLAA